MEKGFSILLLAFAVCILIYAGLLAITKDIKMIPRHYAAKIKNPKEYAVMIAKVTAAVAIAPAAGGIAGLIWNTEETILPSVLALVFGIIICILIGKKIVKNAQF